MSDSALDVEDARLYQAVDKLYSGEGLPGSRKLQICNLDGVGSAAVYGEVTTPETLFRALHLNASDSFIDLGSGVLPKIKLGPFAFPDRC